MSPPKINELTCNHCCEPLEKFATIADMRQSGTEPVAIGWIVRKRGIPRSPFPSQQASADLTGQAASLIGVQDSSCEHRK